MPSQMPNKYVVTCYYYCAGEPENSLFRVIGCYSNNEDAEQAIKNEAKEDIDVMQNTEDEKCEELRKHAKNQQISMKEDEKNIYLKSEKNNISYTKGVYCIRQGLRGTIVGKFKKDGDENKYHFGGYDKADNFSIYNIETLEAHES
jgi:hypothetical protein